MREAEVLVLDEPTAAIDPRAEADVFRSFVATAETRTAVLINHRLGFPRLADRILVLDAGRLVEEGTPEGLARLCDRVVLLQEGRVAEQGTHDALVNRESRGPRERAAVPAAEGGAAEEPRRRCRGRGVRRPMGHRARAGCSVWRLTTGPGPICAS